MFANPLPALLPPTLDVSNLTGNTRVDFVGIKRGDVDQSCSFCGGNLTSGASEERNGNIKEFKGIAIPDRSLEEGEEALIAITAVDELAGLAVASMEWLMGDQIELLEVKFALEGEFSNYRVRRQEGREILHYNWFTMTNGGQDIAAGESLLYLHVKALKKVVAIKDVLSLLPFSQNNTLFYENGIIGAKWHITEPPISSDGRFAVRVLGGNLISGSTAQVEIYLPRAGSLQFVLSDMSGRILSARFLESMEKGWLLHDLALPDNAGIYQLNVMSPSGGQTVRLVKY